MIKSATTAIGKGIEAKGNQQDNQKTLIEENLQIPLKSSHREADDQLFPKGQVRKKGELVMASRDDIESRAHSFDV